MRAYLMHVLRRTLLVLGCLGTGLVGWPGLVGAQESLLNAGRIDASGARRITVAPSAPADAGAQEQGGLGAMVSGFLGSFLGDGSLPSDAGVPPVATGAVMPPGLDGIDPDGALGIAAALRDLPTTMELVGEEREKAIALAASVGAMIAEMDRAEGEAARTLRIEAEAAAAARPPTPGELLFAEFGWQPGQRTPYEISRAALTSRR